MGLKVWLPLNGTLENKGASNYTITSSDSSVVTNGKIGSCMKIISTTSMGYTPDFNNNSLSLGGWFKFNLAEIKAKVDTLTYSSSATSPTGNLLGNTSYGGIGLVWVGNNHYSSGTFSSMSVFATLRTGSVNQSTSSITIEFDKWIHIMLTWDPNTHILSLYKDGALVNSKTFSAFTDGVSRVLSLNYNAIYGGNGPATSIPIYCNDVRIYDHCLSPAEVHEISQGLVLHYKLDGFQGGYGNKNLLAKYVVPGSAGPTSVANGGRTTWLGDYKITIPATENADTYFRLFMTEQLTSGTIYTISCKVSGLLSGSYYKFPLFAQGNTSMGVLNLDHNGLCSLTFTMNWTGTQTAVTGANGETVYVNFLDDSARAIASGQGAITLYDFKLEKGSSATAWCPSDASLTQIQDSSGYNHNGVCVNTTITPSEARYSNCLSCLGTTVDNSSNTITGAQFFYCNMDMPAMNAITIAWWGKNIAYGRGGIFETSNTIQTNTTKGTDYNTTAIANWDSTFGIYNGTTRINIFSNFNKNGNWHYHTITFDGANVKYYCDGAIKQTSALTGSLPAWKNFCMGLGQAGGVWRQIKQNISDLRIYCTALSAADIKHLYEVSAKVDNGDNLHSYEFVETGENKVTNQGQIQGSNLHEIPDLFAYDTQLYIEPDGSKWAHIFHHNNPASYKFASTDTFNSSVYTDINRWFNFAACNLLDKWELFAAVSKTSGATVTKYRWIQTASPMTATFDQTKVANVTRITTTGYTQCSFGGLYHVSGSSWLAMNNGTNNNWYGATGCWTAWNNGIPGWASTSSSDAITSGCIDIYIRVDNIDFNKINLIAKIIKTNKWQGNNLIEF